MRREMAASHLTLKDIAWEAGVSVATLDRVLHGRPGVREDTARRVREAIDRHGFRPFAAGAELARGRSSKFAFVMPEGSNVFMSMILDHVAEMSGWLTARRAAVETHKTNVFNPAALARTLEFWPDAVTGSLSWRSITKAFGLPSMTSSRAEPMSSHSCPMCPARVAIITSASTTSPQGEPLAR